MKIKDAKKLIYKVLSSMPIDVVDEDEGEVWESCNYELFIPREEGDYKGSREIGAANIITAFNLLHQKMLINELSKKDGFSDCLENALDTFKSVMEELEQTKMVRKRPEIQRELFKIVGGTSSAIH